MIYRETEWDKLETIFITIKTCTYDITDRKSHDGRQGLKWFHNHFLGPNNVDHMAAKAEHCLTSSNYHNEKKNWNCERYVTVHKEYH